MSYPVFLFEDIFADCRIVVEFKKIKNESTNGFNLA